MRDFLEYFLVKSLCVGSLLFTMQMPFYYSMLAKFKTKYIVYQSIMQMFISVTLLIYFAKYGDLLTLGIPWIIVNFLSLSYLMYITFSNYIKINITRYFMLCFAVPFFVCGAVGVIGRVLYEISDLNFLFFSIPALIISFLLILNLLNSKEKNTYLKLKKLFNFPKG